MTAEPATTKTKTNGRVFYLAEDAVWYQTNGWFQPDDRYKESEFASIRPTNGIGQLRTGNTARLDSSRSIHLDRWTAMARSECICGERWQRHSGQLSDGHLGALPMACSSKSHERINLPDKFIGLWLERKCFRLHSSWALCCLGQRKSHCKQWIYNSFCVEDNLHLIGLIWITFFTVSLQCRREIGKAIEQASESKA